MTHRRRTAAWARLVQMLLLACATAVAVAGPTAGPGPDDRPVDSAGVVKATLKPARIAARPGGAAAFEVAFAVERGWHLYAHGDTMFYGIALSGLEAGPLAGATIAYPAGEPGEFFGQPVRLLAGRQVVRVSATLPADAAPGRRRLSLALEVQACDDKSCLAPAKLPLTLDLEVAPGRP